LSVPLGYRTEKRVRNAIQTLEAVGFIDRDIRAGSTHIKTDAGELWRKPIKYRFGSDLWPDVWSGQPARCGGPRQAFGPCPTAGSGKRTTDLHGQFSRLSA
jgi:hypothetical protein